MRDIARRADQSHEPNEKPVTVVHFRATDFLSLAKTLRRNYPGEWVALELGEQDTRTGLTPGTIVAHNVIAELTVAPVEAYRAEHPESGIHFFSTNLALAPSRPRRRER